MIEGSGSVFGPPEPNELYYSFTVQAVELSFRRKEFNSPTLPLRPEIRKTLSAAQNSFHRE